jgi:hypothetical protein
MGRWRINTLPAASGRSGSGGFPQPPECVCVCFVTVGLWTLGLHFQGYGIVHKAQRRIQEEDRRPGGHQGSGFPRSEAPGPGRRNLKKA